MKKFISSVVLIAILSACSTSGGIYKKNDQSDGEFSVEKTILTVMGVIGVALLIRNNSGYDNDDYIPSNYSYDANNSIATQTLMPTQTNETITTSTKEVQLAELQRLLDNNLITKEIYFERQNEILRTLGR